MVTVAIRRNLRERRIATFPYAGEEFDALMTSLVDRHIPAIASWSDGHNVGTVAWTREYWSEIKRGYQKYPQYY